MTLLHQLKPEIHWTLLDCAKQYDSVSYLLQKLDTTDNYKKLQIEDVNDILIFGELPSTKLSAWNFKYGDAFFNNK
tara:strand:+ start:461 stop:688 length:228 start_codon:yes stop_codon:yes gene_type:complete